MNNQEPQSRLARVLLVAAFASAAAQAPWGQTTTGTLKVVPPPASVVLNAIEGSCVLVFKERNRVVLTSDLSVDYASPGTYVGQSSTPSTIPAGTAVRSVLLHLDNPGSATINGMGTITFQERILAVIVGSTRLDASDGALGHPLVTYPIPGDEDLRGFERPPNYPDTITISADRRSLTIDEATQSASDQIRVVLACAPRHQEASPPTRWVTTSVPLVASGNPDVRFELVPPVACGRWHFEIDLSLLPGARMTYVLLGTRALRKPLSVSWARGRLLVGGELALLPSASGRFDVPVPAQVAHHGLGLGFVAQGAALTREGLFLLNGLEARLDP